MSKFNTDNPPKDDDYSPEALAYREQAEEQAKAQKPEVGVDGHPPHAVFSESEHPRIPEGEPNMEPAPTDFDSLKQ